MLLCVYVGGFNVDGEVCYFPGKAPLDLDYLPKPERIYRKMKHACNPLQFYLIDIGSRPLS